MFARITNDLFFNVPQIKRDKFIHLTSVLSRSPLQHVVRTNYWNGNALCLYSDVARLVSPQGHRLS